MVERKRLSSDEAGQYIGVARNLLTQLKQSMTLNNLKVLQRAVDLPGGVRVIVSSIFGNDTITIHAPPDVEAAIARAAQVDQQRQARRPEEQREVPVEVVFTFEDTVLARDSATVTATVKSTLSTPAPRVYVAGTTSGVAVYGTPEKGYGGFPILSTIQRNATIVAISSDGAWFAGSIDTYNSNISSFTGKEYGWVRKACVWKSLSSAPTVFTDSDPSYSGAVTGFINSRSICVKRGVDPKLTHQYTAWDGASSGLTSSPYTGSVPSATGKTALGGRVQLYTNTYLLDGVDVKWSPTNSSGTCLVAIQDPATGTAGYEYTNPLR